MSAAIWAALILLGLGIFATALVRLPPRRALAVLVLAAAGGLALRRLFPLAVPLFAFGVGLWRSAPAAPTPGGRSEVESPGLRMSLDRDSGAMDGEVTSGPLTGARLSALAEAELQQLAAQFEAEGDEDSLHLLRAWLDRHGFKRAAGSPPPDPSTMTPAEAYRVLGLEPEASREEVRAAYRRLIRRVHPDLGGSSPLAAMLNAAKELLDPG